MAVFLVRARLLFAWLLVMAFAGVASAATPAEQSLFLATNQARAEQGLAPLVWDDALAQAARAHAELIVQNSQLSHQYPGEAALALRAAQAGAHFQSIAENIALGPSAESIHRQWMKSPPHRANILDPNLDAAGFAAIEIKGTWYAVADFERRVSSLSFDEVEAAVEKQLAAKGVQLGGSREDARQTCEMSQGEAGGSSPRFVMRWQSSDLSRLPPALERELGNGHYRAAAVGACSSANAEKAFTAYRVAVLLY